MSPDAPPGLQGPIVPPPTRVTSAWSKMWRGILVNNPKLTARARFYSAHARRRGGHR